MRRYAFRALLSICVLLALIVTAWAADTEQLAADSDVYATLYEDGTMVSQPGNTSGIEQVITATYSINLTDSDSLDYETYAVFVEVVAIERFLRQSRIGVASPAATVV